LILFSLFYIDSQVWTEHFALETAGAEFGVGNKDRLEPFLRDPGGFFKDFLGADFQADIAPLAPLPVQVDGCRLFLFFHAFFQSKGSPFPREEAFKQPMEFRIDEPIKSGKSIKFVIPAKAGIQLFQEVLDPGFSRGGDAKDFLGDHQD
jgi:hypothetical protein